MTWMVFALSIILVLLTMLFHHTHPTPPHPDPKGSMMFAREHLSMLLMTPFPHVLCPSAQVTANLALSAQLTSSAQLT